MPSRRKRFDYKAVAKQLRSYGYHVRYGSGKKGTTSAQHKTAVRKIYNKIAPLYITNRKQTFKFFPFKKKALRITKRASIAGAQATPGGVFMRVPKGIDPGNYHYEIGGEGEIISYSVGPRGGQRKETVYDLDPVKLAEDPEQAVKSLLAGKPRPFQARLVVNGNEAHVPLDWKAFLEYAPEKISFIMDPNLDLSGEQARLHGGDGMSEEEFAEIFQVKTIHQIKAPPSKSRAKKKSTKRAKKRKK